MKCTTGFTTGHKKIALIIDTLCWRYLTSLYSWDRNVFFLIRFMCLDDLLYEMTIRLVIQLSTDAYVITGTFVK